MKIMKKEKNIETKAKSQNRQGIGDDCAESRLTRNRIIRKVTESKGDLNIFLTLNLGKAPPDQARSPGAGRGHPPENKAGPPTDEPPYKNQNQPINHIQNSNIYENLNFKIMKKQFLILVFFVLATLASVTNSFGQATALRPAAGIAYTYTMTNPALPAATPTFDWYVTKNTNLTAGIITVPSPLFTVTTQAQYHNTGAGLASIEIAWTQAAVADGGPFYLVLRYTEKAGACTIENIRVDEIKPISTFVLALEGGTFVTPNYVATSGSNTCPANLTAASIVTGTPSTATYTYSNSTIYYVATASGINGTWYPQIRLPLLAGNQVYVSAGWSSDMTGTGTFNLFGVAATGASQDLLDGANAATAVAGGTPILIKVVINNMNYQTTADQPLELALDGFLPPTPIAILTAPSDVTSLTDPAPVLPFTRKATYTINKRPDPTGTPVFLGPTY
jgi:hypothetical protein